MNNLKNPLDEYFYKNLKNIIHKWTQQNQDVKESGMNPLLHYIKPNPGN